MRRKWNIILIAVLLMITSVFMSACQSADGEQDAPVSSEQNNSTEDEISDEPIEYDGDYVEDDEIMDEDSSEEILDDHEDEAVIDEPDIEFIEEEEAE